jgi:hypothetical protein
MVHPRAGAGDDEAQVQYDRYATALLANACGGDATQPAAPCANTALKLVPREAAGAGGSVARLVALHSRWARQPHAARRPLLRRGVA